MGVVVDRRRLVLQALPDQPSAAEEGAKIFRRLRQRVRKTSSRALFRPWAAYVRSERLIVAPFPFDYRLPSLVAACDLVVASTASKFTMGYTRAGLVPDGTSSFYLSRVVGLRRAAELMLTNRTLNAAEALDWGLVNELAEPDAVRGRAEELARTLAAGATAAFGGAKRVLYQGASSSLEEAMERESSVIGRVSGLPDAREGIASFLEKRPPAFDGRTR